MSLNPDKRLTQINYLDNHLVNSASTNDNILQDSSFFKPTAKLKRKKPTETVESASSEISTWVAKKSYYETESPTPVRVPVSHLKNNFG